MAPFIMHKREVFFYSPFSHFSVKQHHHAALLLQFILFEILSALKQIKKDSLEALYTPERILFPYDWSKKIGIFNKIQEHALLLESAFPKLKNSVSLFYKSLAYATEVMVQEKQSILSYLRSLFQLLLPFIESCKENEELLFFLIKNHQLIAEINPQENSKDLLLKMYPRGLKFLSRLLGEHYRKRGYSSIASEIEPLMKELDESYPLTEESIS